MSATGSLADIVFPLSYKPIKLALCVRDMRDQLFLFTAQNTTKFGAGF